MNLFDIKGKIAVITGGGGELCGTMAEALGNLGAKVAILDINLEKANGREASIKEKGGEAKAFGCDVLSEDQLAEYYSIITGLWGLPDILINGAGGNDPRGSTSKEILEIDDIDLQEKKGFFNLTLEGFKYVFDLNFIGTFLTTKIFSRGMVKKKGGSIVNISSMSAFTPLTKVAAYSSAKAAVSNFTKWLAVHFSHLGVRVNAIAPGFFMTEQLRFLQIDQKTGELLPRAKKVIGHTPMGRYGNPEDLIGTLVWLVSGASKFVTGIVVPVDGGFSSFTI